MWVLIAGEGLAIVLALAPSVVMDRWVLFGLTSLAIQWVTLLTLGELFLLRGLFGASRPMGVARIAIALLLINTWLVVVAAHLIAPDIDAGEGSTPTELFWQATGIATAVGLLGLAAFQNYWRARQLAMRAQQAELEALQARIRPHFLFNTLNTGAALVHSRPGEAERLLLDLADLFRAALAGPRDISLEDELSLVRRYLEIEQLRFGDRLRVEWDVPGSIPAVQVPALSIQPLVENAIRHGVERVPHGGRVEIALTTTAEHVVVRIRNPLVFSDAAPPLSHGVGLNASQARIEALTGGRGSVQTGRKGEHWVATVRLPRRPASADRRRRV
ncbi:sensor histidine kinase [Cognatilysobacter bugurensis]|uniref:Alginate biosynthesis protein AlgZ/FimS n=1 Tax=Cognatilysobacter bugurensis TaxID=543356 RepID=A0A918W788_9GAMM|nr:histidine kinase [Lysobacter bugurensis]GHA76296.1 alginate biosynthesis protein AlgZ/FimS [Lysobacter bugurensis]